MLLELRLKDFVLIPEARLNLKPGFVVFTGETGAGKSLLVQSLKLLLGGRGGGHLIRPGAQEAVLEAVLTNPALPERLSALGLPASEEVVLRRVISPERSRVHINGSPATVQMLARLVEGLIVLASQHEHQVLARPGARLRLLDAYGGLLKEASAFAKAFSRYQEKKRTYEEAVSRLRQAVRERDYLEFQLREIEAVSPRPGEDEELEAEAKRLRNLSKLKRLLAEASSLAGEGASLLGSARKTLSEARACDPSLGPLADRLEGLFYEVDDLASELSRALYDLPQEDSRLAEVEERLYQLKKLIRKYGPDLKSVLEERERLRRELEALKTGEEGLSSLEKEVLEAEEEVLSLGERLSEKRKEAARRLTEEVRRVLASLAMPEVRFRVEVTRLEAPRESGLDQVEFTMASSPKAPLRPVSQVASGGELSRLFLALKTVASGGEGTSLAVFDEVDTGVGGNVARRLGELLLELSRNLQVICVTHLPQVASLADQHFFVRKEQAGDEVLTRVEELTSEGRLAEISRMLGGPQARDLAEKMLKR